MTRQVHKGNTLRRTTLVYRLFRMKNATLSKQYWTSEAGRHALRSALSAAEPTSRAVEVIGKPFDTRHLNETVRDLLSGLDQRAGIDRLYLLVICSANLESFLQDAIALYVAHLGHRTADRCLDAVGKAMASPVVDRSSVPGMLEYVEHLLGLNFGQGLSDWRRGYKLRCSAAHEGGQMSADTAKKIGAARSTVGDWITVSWGELKALMDAAHRIADSVDSKISSDSLLAFEVEWTLAQWQRDRTLPPQNRVWTVLHGLGMKVQRPKQRAMEKWLYA